MKKIKFFFGVIICILIVIFNNDVKAGVVWKNPDAIRTANGSLKPSHYILNVRCQAGYILVNGKCKKIGKNKSNIRLF